LSGQPLTVSDTENREWRILAIVLTGGYVVLGTAQKVNCFAGTGSDGITELAGNFLAP
jgi:hypothetical protein